MKITFLNEAGVFGTYKKSTAQSNIDNVKKELAREAALNILQTRCDELAELFLDMLNEVNSQTTAISRKHKYVSAPPSPRIEETSNLVELTNYMTSKLVKRNYKIPVKEMQLNLIKNLYCNNHAIEFMMSHGCFIIPLVDTERRLSQTFFNDAEEIPSYKNMTKTVAAAVEKVIKSHISKFPNYTNTAFPNYTISIIPNTVKIIILQDEALVKYESMQEQKLFSYMGVTDSGVNFKYPGKGSSCLDYIVNTCSLFTTHFSINLTKSYEHIFKEMADPSPWMLNKFVFRSVFTKISTLIADNFYGIKLLKFALNNDIIMISPTSIMITIDNILKNIQYINKLKQEVSNNGLDHLVKYNFYDNNAEVDSLIMIGKELSAEQVEQEGIDIDNLKRRVYEFDYNDSSEVKRAAKDIINGCSRFLTNVKIKKITEDEIAKYLPSLMGKVLTSRPACASSSNKVLLCEYNKNLENTNIRVVINTRETEINKKGNLVFYIAIDFKLPIRGTSSKNNVKDTRQWHGKRYAFVTGKKIKIEIPL